MSVSSMPSTSSAGRIVALLSPASGGSFMTEYGDEASEATPKTIMRTMGVKGLTLYHLKSHLQKYRLGAKSKEVFDSPKDETTLGESLITEQSPPPPLKIPQEMNDGCDEAMRVQMELQRRLHEHLEVQHHLHQRIEAQERYLNSMLEKAMKALTDAPAPETHVEGAAHNLSELAIFDPHDPLYFPQFSSWSGIAHQPLTKRPVEFCLTSAAGPRVSSKRRPPADVKSL
ncbi:protein PHR1-LIKE 3-like isoform X2 [Wolffia australiana]